ncbi:hypothetical protein [Natronococcus sp. A-GB7]|uniref:hypothetical protein n=1 Tax=Natronococcus sp. A-GB7 TaxID=3037649 RepID=UPI00241E060F|nr:hypothetical protein [Natronococcus sp. A-GB7]MDG5821298.1 hypothetical protein [Natronococcus sp. A-GB7]
MAMNIADVLESAVHHGANDNENVGVGMNSEFLREGSTVSGFMHPDTVIYGPHSE